MTPTFQVEWYDEVDRLDIAGRIIPVARFG